jgi:hypothetical protein
MDKKLKNNSNPPFQHCTYGCFAALVTTHNLRQATVTIIPPSPSYKVLHVLRYLLIKYGL